MTPGSRSTGAGGTPPGPARSSRPWNFRVSLSPAPTPPQWCCPTWLGSSSPHAQRADVATQAGGPGGWPTLMCQVLTTRAPGSGVPAAAVLAGRDPGQGPPGTGAQLASYAGLAPVTRRSGSSIRGEHVSHGGNKRLKRAMFPSAFASLQLRPGIEGTLPAEMKLGTAVWPGHLFRPPQRTETSPTDSVD